jgi:Fe-S cluster assembly ATPase SufC
LDAFKTIAKLLKNISTKENSLIIVTHNFDICDYIDIDEVHVIDN